MNLLELFSYVKRRLDKIRHELLNLVTQSHYLLLPELEYPDGAQRDAGHGRVAAQLGVRVTVPPTHVVPAPITNTA